ncbi:putative NBD/HSP70 family sugar kinase [Cryobacterium sp. MP_3.1]|uniref:Sugar kinase n=1 Tax=Cryobacterium zongtaii TaxID=1259217 RepID=A0A2S3ZC44_9MICO|nr:MULTISPECIES: ROK family transcriptional regulator [Cryobacterium]MEC5185055.1 putative NBD/HSP70 family sugar kinase [Cryobacterium sp. MP_3.1]POH63313.1 sugar kinase [Cryobacterium zongtaii]
MTATGTPRTIQDRALRPTAKVLPEHIRLNNRTLVLQTLYRTGLQSRADLARETGLTRVTVSDLISELMGENLVIELGQRQEPRPGKPATLLDINRSAFQIVSLDLSGHTRLRGAVLSLDGAVLSSSGLDLAGARGEAAYDTVAALLAQVIAGATAPILGVGIGSPGIVDRAGVVRNAPNLGWRDQPLQARLQELTGLPVRVVNDANAAVLAEHSFGGADHDLLLVKVGHGVGAGLLIGGRAIFGERFAAGEIGHVVVGTDDGPLCACGKSGCLEAWLSVPRLTAAIHAATAAAATPADADRATSDILTEAGRRLGIILAPVVGALNLLEIVLSGPPELLDGALSAATVETLRSRTMATETGDLTLRMTAQGEDIVLRGAAVMVLSAQLGVS